jgi:hypothetical protein
MSKPSVEEVITGIVGQRVCKVQLQLVSNSRLEPVESSTQYFLYFGNLKATLEFTTKEELKESQFGSLVLCSAELVKTSFEDFQRPFQISSRDYIYKAALLYGKETGEIIQAFATDFERN